MGQKSNPNSFHLISKKAVTFGGAFNVTEYATLLKDYFSVLPAFRGIYHNISYNYENIISSKVDKAYISEDEASLTIDEIKQILKKNNLLEKPDQSILRRYWPGDKEQNS